MMIAKLTGTIDTKEDNSVIVDCRGVGYAVAVSQKTFEALPECGQTVQLLTEYMVKNETPVLMGFMTSQEQWMFRTLIAVPGVGSKMALSILSALTCNELAQAIQTQDAAAIARANGVGGKLANRIVLELKSKVLSIAPHTSNQDAVTALIQLGYTRDVSANYAHKAYQTLGVHAKLEDVIRHVLQNLV